MQSYIAIVGAVLALILWARPEDLHPNISSITANLKIGKTIEVAKLEEPVFRKVICNFSIAQTQSTPPSVILAGKVVSNNSGGAQEFTPIFFGSTFHPPRLAALTDVNGEFRFRVWLLDRPRKGEQLRLTAKTMGESTLYLEGKFDKDAEMISSYTHIHSLREFLEGNAKKKP